MISMLMPVITGYLLFRKRGRLTDRRFVSSERLESLWIIIPRGMLFFIVVPSLRLLYLVDEVFPRLTFKAEGFQWYWGYDNPYRKYDSFAIFAPSIEYQGLECDKRLGVPFLEDLQVLITSSDVIHSWSLPTIGVKGDAVPGRVNTVSFTPRRPGIYFGQCREICGANHSIIPIVTECYLPCPPVPVVEVETWQEKAVADITIVGERNGILIESIDRVLEVMFGKG